MNHFSARSIMGLTLLGVLWSFHVISAFSVATEGAVRHGYSNYHFGQYLQEFGKRYKSDAEYAYRKSQFEKNMAIIKEHNAGDSSYMMGVNDMSDWDTSETSRLNGAKPHMRHHVMNKKLRTEYSVTKNGPRKFQVDYRTAVPPVLTAVKNQGNCGSCWAHSAVEAIESHWAISTGKLYVLSQQQLTSCVPNPRHCGGTGGCDGSVESLGFEYVHEVGGIAEEWGYSYTSFYGDSGVCNNDTDQVSVIVNGYASVPQNDQDIMMDAVANVGPIAVSVDASQWTFYAGGIFDGCDFGKNITQNHAVQLVGYGHDYTSGKDYWIIRNSWGPRWGENGYMRLLRETKASCGWSVNTHSGSACDGDPDEEWVCGMCGVLSGATFPIV